MSDDPTPVIAVDVVVDAADVDAYFEFQRRVLRRTARANTHRWAFVVIVLAGVLFLTGFAVIVLADVPAMVKAAAALMAVGFFVLRFAPVMTMRRALLATSSPLNGRYTLDREGLTHERDDIRWFVPSGRISGLVITDQHALFHLADGRSVVIPLRCIRPQRDVQAATALLASYVART